MSGTLSDSLLAAIRRSNIQNGNPTQFDFMRYFGNDFNLEPYFDGPAEIIPNAPIESPLRAMTIPNDTLPVPTLIESPTFNNAPPVGQYGQPDPLPFFKYAPPVGQNVINWIPQNPDERITIEEAPPVPQNSPFSSLEAMLQFLKTYGYTERR